MTIASEITRLENAKASIKQAIGGKGVSVPTSAKIDTYDTYISQIETGGGGGGGSASYFYVTAAERGNEAYSGIETIIIAGFTAPSDEMQPDWRAYNGTYTVTPETAASPIKQKIFLSQDGTKKYFYYTSEWDSSGWAFGNATSNSFVGICTQDTTNPPSGSVKYKDEMWNEQTANVTVNSASHPFKNNSISGHIATYDDNGNLSLEAATTIVTNVKMTLKDSIEVNVWPLIGSSSYNSGYVYEPKINPGCLYNFTGGQISSGIEPIPYQADIPNAADVPYLNDVRAYWATSSVTSYSSNIGDVRLVANGDGRPSQGSEGRWKYWTLNGVCLSGDFKDWKTVCFAFNPDAEQANDFTFLLYLVGKEVLQNYQKFGFNGLVHTLTPNKWHFASVSYWPDGLQEMWIDGKLWLGQRQNDSISTEINYFALGGFYTQYERRWRGKISNISFYNRCFSEAEHAKAMLKLYAAYAMRSI